MADAREKLKELENETNLLLIDTPKQKGTKKNKTSAKEGRERRTKRPEEQKNSKRLSNHSVPPKGLESQLAKEEEELLQIKAKM